MNLSVLIGATLLYAVHSQDAAVVSPAEPYTIEEKLTLQEAGGGNRRLLQGVPIVYKGEIDLCSNSGAVTSSFPCGSNGTECDPAFWDWWKFPLEAGIEYSIRVNRIDCELDPAMVLFRGTGTTTEDLECFWDGTSTSELMYVLFADDNVFPDGCPFGDPQIIVTPADSGMFSLAVVNFFSDPCPSDGYDYEIVISGTKIVVVKASDASPICTLSQDGTGCVDSDFDGEVNVYLDNLACNVESCRLILNDGSERDVCENFAPYSFGDKGCDNPRDCAWDFEPDQVDYRRGRVALANRDMITATCYSNGACNRGRGEVVAETTVSIKTDCFEPRGTPGCSVDPICETIVCDIENLCCIFVWNDFCAETAQEECV